VPTDPSYFDSGGRDDVLSGGVKLIPVETPRGVFRVWTKRVGNNPRTRLLLLHGGPGSTHEYFEAFDSYLPAAGVEYYYYDQLGSLYSDQPDEPDLWELDRFVDEVEQVRRALGLDRDSFFLLGHSWGGILAIEYALRHQRHLKGLLEPWDRTADLGGIEVPTLVIGAQHDTMDPSHMAWMAGAVRRGTYLHCPDGSYMAMYDDQSTYMDGLIQFLRA
jgi:pimeloyl-ACP methyl ester carboxylesterase